MDILNSKSLQSHMAGRNRKRTAECALDQNDNAGKTSASASKLFDSASTDLTHKLSSTITSPSEEPVQKRVRLRRESQHLQGIQMAHDHTNDSERYFSYMNRDDVFGKSGVASEPFHFSFGAFIKPPTYSTLDHFSLQTGRRLYCNNNDNDNGAIDASTDDSQKIASHLLKFSEISYLAHAQLNESSVVSEILYGS
ncbi:hypothetical protein BDF19DRAFT_432778 [Syncephalis fuscata]|nr:hypothetical protein BDF19DRAFT_432778 [Syncephalis fuscata]